MFTNHPSLNLFLRLSQNGEYIIVLNKLAILIITALIRLMTIMMLLAALSDRK